LLKLSAHIGYLFTEQPLVDRFLAARDAASYPSISPMWCGIRSRKFSKECVAAGCHSGKQRPPRFLWTVAGQD
jgi:hypothetical protein